MLERSTKNQHYFFSTKPLLRRIGVFLSQSSFYQSLSKKFHTEVVFSRRSLKAAKKSQIKGLEVDRDGFGKKSLGGKKIKRSLSVFRDFDFHLIVVFSSLV